MPALLRQMGSHEVWVLGTPIYWLGPTAQFKAFIDRWHAPWAGVDTRRLFDGRRVVLATSMESPKPGSAQPTIAMLTGAFGDLGIAMVDHVVAAGRSPSETGPLPDGVLQRAYRAGQDLVRLTRL